MFIHERPNWTNFYWDVDAVAPLIDKVRLAQGHLYGRLEGLGFDVRLREAAENLTVDIVRSSEIEGVVLDMEKVRSSVARRLGIESARTAPSRVVEAVVEVMLAAMERCDRALDEETLFAWQSAFFPGGFGAGRRIEVGRWRTCEEQVVSGAFGRERVHYEAPAPSRVPGEMARFLEWFNSTDGNSCVVRAAIAHLWFVCVHPFEDGNGRLARILADMQLARGVENRMRFYNVSSQILLNRKEYYRVLESTQRGSGDVTEWLVWFMGILLRSLDAAEATVDRVMGKARFWSRFSDVDVSERERKVLNAWLDGREGKIASKSWAKLGGCSADTANRDLQDLCRKGMLVCDDPSAKRRSYRLAEENRE